MRFGIHLANFGPATSAEGILGLAGAAEELGFDSVWVSDHVVVPASFVSSYPYPGTTFTPDAAATVFEPLVTLAVVAGATNRVRVGTSVLIVPQRNPLVLAKQLSTLDALSGGRLDVGVGAGWLAEEFAVLGAPFAQRGPVLEEWLAIWRRVWSEREPGFEGRHYRFAPVRFEPKPVRPGGPPLFVGGHSAPALRRAATLADGWNAFRLTPDEVAGALPRLHRHAEAVGRDPAALQVLVRVNVDVSETPADPPAPPWQLSGAPGEVAAAIGRYEAAGATALLFTPAPGRPVVEARRNMERLAGEVLPLLRK